MALWRDGAVTIALCVRVKKNLGELTISTLTKMHLINTDLKIMAEKNFIHIPISRPLTEKEFMELKSIGEFKILSKEFASRFRRPKTLLEVLDGKISPNLLASLPHSFDVIGDIAVLEMPLELWNYRKLVGDALMQINRGVHTVMAKLGAVSGPFRLRQLEVVAGEGKTETMHRENGCMFLLDVTKVYFSPRLAHEHNRVAGQVGEYETVIDMFAGVGPFSILIAKKRMNVTVYAIDINPYAIHYLKENVRINKVVDHVVPILGNAEDVINNRLSHVADRVIMNLPEKASEFLEAALKALKPSGGTIHFYTFYKGERTVKIVEDSVKEAVQKLGRCLESASGRIVKPSAPNEWLVVIDAMVS